MDLLFVISHELEAKTCKYKFRSKISQSRANNSNGQIVCSSNYSGNLEDFIFADGKYFL